MQFGQPRGVANKRKLMIMMLNIILYRTYLLIGYMHFHAHSKQSSRQTGRHTSTQTSTQAQEQTNNVVRCVLGSAFYRGRCSHGFRATRSQCTTFIKAQKCKTNTNDLQLEILETDLREIKRQAYCLTILNLLFKVNNNLNFIVQEF